MSDPFQSEQGTGQSNRATSELEQIPFEPEDDPSPREGVPGEPEQGRSERKHERDELQDWGVETEQALAWFERGPSEARPELGEPQDPDARFEHALPEHQHVGAPIERAGTLDETALASLHDEAPDAPKITPPLQKGIS